MAHVGTDDTPVKTDNPQVETDKTHVKTDAVYVKTYNAPVKTDTVSVQTDDTQVKTDKAHVLTDKPSVKCFITKFNTIGTFKHLFSEKVANFYIKCEKVLQYGSTHYITMIPKYLNTITKH
jgi:hypothetical protein